MTSPRPDPTLHFSSDRLLQGGSIDPSSSATAQTRVKPERAKKMATPPQATPPAPGSEAASWLPEGWLLKEIVRTSGATAGIKDKYYIDPVTGRRFRSKREVQRYLETGTLPKKEKTMEKDANVNSSGSSGSRTNKKADTTAKTSGCIFDAFNVPEKAEWVLTDASADVWTAFIGGEKVPEYEKQQWEFAFSSLSRNRDSTMF